MRKREASAPEPPGLSRFVVVVLVVTAIWVLSGAVVVHWFPTWEARSGVGDMFGAVNALFSGLALAGVIYAILLQRDELRLQRAELQQTRDVLAAQLGEMKTARQLQTQPLVVPAASRLVVDRPAAFYSPPDQQYSAHSRVHLQLGIANPSEFPAIGVHFDARLVLSPGNDNSLVVGTTSAFLEVVAPGQLDADTGPSFLFLPPREFLDRLAQPDQPRRWPVVSVEVLYKNMLGGHFRVRQMYLVWPEGRQTRILHRWKSHLESFDVTHRADVDALGGLTDGKVWQERFDRMREQFEVAVAKDRTELWLEVRPIRQRFTVETATEAEYATAVGRATYAHPTTPDSRCNAGERSA